MAKGSRNTAPLLITVLLVVMMNVGGLFVLSAAGVIELPTNDEPVPAASEPQVVEASADLALVANQAVNDAVTTQLPESWKPTGEVERRAADLFAYACGHWPIPASLSAQRAVDVPVVGSATISTYAVPAGYGAATVDAVYDFVTSCPGNDSDPWGERATLNRASAVILGLTSGEQTATQVLWNRGDLLLSISAGGQPPLIDAAKRWDRNVAAAVSRVCRDLTGKPSDARRNPWVDPDRYTGLIENETVSVAQPQILIEMLRKPRKVRDLPAEVERPEPPTRPHWPPALPAELTRPERPSKPAEPDLERKISYQVPDPTGPGCGWTWLSQPAPPFTESEALERRSRAATEAQDRLRKAADKWLVAETRYRQALGEYYAQALLWKDYARQVDAAARSWQRTQDAWDEYESALAAYEDAVARRAAWKREYKDAAAAYAAALERCAEDPGPTITPSPSPSPTSADCPPDKPSILDESRPWIPPKPTPPADPSPKTMRR